MTTPVLYTGDDWSRVVNLYENTSEASTLEVSDTIKAAVVTRDRSTTLISAVTLDSGHASADWPSGVVVVSFTAAQTANAASSLKDGRLYAVLEIQVDDGVKATWEQEILLRKGTIA